MTTLHFVDHDLSRQDFSTFELLLQGRGGAFSAEERSDSSGTPGHVQLLHPAVSFDEQQIGQPEIEEICRRFGFRHQPA